MPRKKIIRVEGDQLFFCRCFLTSFLSVSKRTAKSIYIYIYIFFFRARATNPALARNPPRVCRHGVRLPLKLSLSQHGPVLEEICGIVSWCNRKKSRMVANISLIHDISRRSSRAPLRPGLRRNCQREVRLPNRSNSTSRQ